MLKALTILAAVAAVGHSQCQSIFIGAAGAGVSFPVGVCSGGGAGNLAGSQKYACVNSTHATLMVYSSADCTGTPTSTSSVTNNIVTTVNCPAGGVVCGASYGIYANAQCTGTPTSSVSLVTGACQGLTTALFCSGSNIVLATYAANSNCTGTPVSTVTIGSSCTSSTAGGATVGWKAISCMGGPAAPTTGTGGATKFSAVAGLMMALVVGAFFL